MKCHFISGQFFNISSERDLVSSSFTLNIFPPINWFLILRNLFGFFYNLRSSHQNGFGQLCRVGLCLRRAWAWRLPPTVVSHNSMSNWIRMIQSSFYLRKNCFFFKVLTADRARDADSILARIEHKLAAKFDTIVLFHEFIYLFIYSNIKITLFI